MESVAQQTAGSLRVYTLEECLKIGASENLEVQGAVANAMEASARLRSAFAGYLPTASISLGYSRTLNTVTGFNLGGQVQEIPIRNPDLFFASGNVGYLLFDGFAREHNHTAAQLSQSAADNTLAQTRCRVLNTIRSQYLAILRAKQTLRIRREDFELGKKQLERLREQYKAGVLAIAPVLTQEADVANRELAVVQAENDLDLAKGALLTTLGMNPSAHVDFADVSIPSTVSDTDIREFRSLIGDFATACTTAISKRLDLRAAQSSFEAAQETARAAQGSWLPTISAGYQYSWNGNSLSFFEYGRQGLGVSLDYTIFNGFQRDVSIQRAQIQEQQALIQRRQAEQRVIADVQNAFVQLSAAEKSLDITARALHAAQQNFDAAEERFKVGAANILDYTIANANLATAKINRVSALYNYIAARYQMQFSLGLLEE
ncbi:MAG: TolC family protein [Bacteroidota bacterium]|nr:TolC family protein [Candidatus Kapabacteria bacterium]MDW8219501.1 TolC family protein [Bacteroidota bacterium]